MNSNQEAEYTKAIEAAEKALENIHKDKTDWKISKTTKHVTISSKKSPHFHGYMHRLECVLDVPMAKSFEYYVPSPIGLRHEWDKTLQLHECIGNLAEETYIFRAITHSQLMGLIASREFIYILKVARSEDEDVEYIRSVCTSVEHPDYPLRQNPVRGVNYPCGTYFDLIPETKQTRLTNYYHVDLGGKLPQSVLDSTVPQLMGGIIDSYLKKLKSIKK